MSDGEYKAGRFKVSAAPSTESTSIGRFRLIPQGSPFLQRGRFSAIPEEESSPAVRQGPEITVDPSPEWDFQVSSNAFDNVDNFLIKFRWICNFPPIYLNFHSKFGLDFFSPHSSEKSKQNKQRVDFQLREIPGLFSCRNHPVHCVVFVRLLWQSSGQRRRLASSSYRVSSSA